MANCAICSHPGIAETRCYRDCGRDLPRGLQAAGFVDATILPADPCILWSAAREVVCARRAPSNLKDAA